MALRFLASVLLRRACTESTEGDLLEQFEEDVQNLNVIRAKRRLLLNVLRFFRPAILFRNKFYVELNQSYMYKSYFKIMARHMVKQRFYSTITILGLTVGITFALLIGIFIWGEIQVNTSLKDIDRLYLMETKYKATEGNQPPFFVPALLGQQAIEQYPTVFENFIAFVIATSLL